MQTTAIIVWIYGVLVLVGGLMGWVKAKSKPSLVSGLIFGVLLILQGYWIWQGSASGVMQASVTTGLLAVVMGARFIATKKFMPAGLLTLLSLAVLITLLLRR